MKGHDVLYIADQMANEFEADIAPSELQRVYI